MRRTVVRVDPLSVLKISLFFYAIFVVLWLILVAILYQFANGLGLFDAIEGFGEVVVGYENVDITLGVVERWAFLVGVILAVLGSLLNLFLAFLYNVAADLIGGVNVTFVERDV